MNDPPVRIDSIPSALITWCDAVARATALLLSCCEPRDAEGRPRSPHRDADSLLSAAADELRRVAPHPGALKGVGGKILRLPFAREPREELRRVERRLAKLVLSKWVATVRPDSPARPDVLALTTQLLTNPNSPFTYHVVRFSLLAALRSLYGVSHDRDSLGLLRTAYNHLRGHSDTSADGEPPPDARHQALILDILHVEGWIPRHHPSGGPHEYYDRFVGHVLGVPSNPHEVPRPEPPTDLGSHLPDFGTLQGLVFAHPTGVPGLDFVTGGLLPAMQNPDTNLDGGLATLISGPPGTGKTSLCLTLGTRLAELGSFVDYVTTEEGGDALESKRQSMVEPLSLSLAMPLSCVEKLATPEFRVIDGSQFTSLDELASLLLRSEDTPAYPCAPPAVAPAEPTPDVPVLEFAYVFPRVVIIDSVTALLQLSQDRAREASIPRVDPFPASAYAPGPGEGSLAPVPGGVYPTRIELRRALAETLTALRQKGVCVILVGGKEDGSDEALAYLVDNVFALSVVEGEDRSHPLLSLAVDKMRFQNTQRERHVFHLAGPDGPTVSPSLHAVLRRLDRLPHHAADDSVRAFVWESETHSAKQPSHPLTIHGRAQSLVYGFGASGKSRFAMSLAMEARVPTEPAQEFREYMARRATGRNGLTDADRRRLSEARVLVVSFQYGPEYYRQLATQVLRGRFGCTSERPEKHVDVIDFYPGAVDAESVVRRVRMRLRQGEVNGTPHTAVVLDGVHNIVAQFPALARERLLWPTLYQLFRTYGIDTITTFTFFRIPSPSRGEKRKDEAKDPRELLHNAFDREPNRKVRDVEQEYFQTLITSCDYSFVIEPPLSPPQPALRNVVRIQLSSSIERSVEAPLRIIWDADAFAQKRDYPLAESPR